MKEREMMRKRAKLVWNGLLWVRMKLRLLRHTVELLTIYKELRNIVKMET